MQVIFFYNFDSGVYFSGENFAIRFNNIISVCHKQLLNAQTLMTIRMQGTVNENAASIRRILRILAAFSFTVPCILIVVIFVFGP